MEARKYKDLPHYVYEDYVQWEGRWELIDGIPYAMSPAPAKYHQKVNARIVTELTNLLDDCPKCDAYLFLDYKIANDTIVQPDALVLCEEFKEEPFITDAPEIIFEILSPSTRRKDINQKFGLYEKAGVKYYVIVDPVDKTCSVFHLEDEAYKLMLKTSDETYDFNIMPCPIKFNFGKIW